MRCAHCVWSFPEHLAGDLPNMSDNTWNKSPFWLYLAMSTRIQTRNQSARTKRILQTEVELQHVMIKGPTTLLKHNKCCSQQAWKPTREAQNQTCTRSRARFPCPSLNQLQTPNWASQRLRSSSCVNNNKLQFKFTRPGHRPVVEGIRAGVPTPAPVQQMLPAVRAVGAEYSSTQTVFRCCAPILTIS